MRNLFGNDNLVAIGHFETLLKVKLSKSNAHSPHSVVALLEPTNTHVNVLRMSPKLLQTQPHIVENQGITMTPLF